MNEKLFVQQIKEWYLNWLSNKYCSLAATLFIHRLKQKNSLYCFLDSLKETIKDLDHRNDVLRDDLGKTNGRAIENYNNYMKADIGRREERARRVGLSILVGVMAFVIFILVCVIVGK